jgi:hypothetical protein
MSTASLAPALGLWLYAVAAAAAPQQAAPAAPDLRPPLQAGAHGGETKCGACHSTDSWGDVAFAHERTGFPLVGGHKLASCKQCHPQSFSRPISHQCTACHKDPHRGQLGALCQGCHDELSWKSKFDADAHRRTGFPLTGRHAFLPCESCHGNVLDRSFARPVSTCFDCHQRDYERTRQAAFVDHVAWGLGTECKDCHVPWHFTGAFFPAHERCFQLSGGPHAGIRCQQCHTAPPTGVVPGTCSTNNAACQRCHTCDAALTQAHATVLGFQCADRKCYECHRFAVGAPLRGVRSR